VGGVCDYIFGNQAVNNSGKCIHQRACSIEMRAMYDAVLNAIYHVRSVGSH
jgi:hypothetical protein